MERKIRVAQIGCGKMSKYTMRYAIEKGAEVVLAFDVSKEVIGSDIGSIMETTNRNIKVEDIATLEERLMEVKPDIAIVTTMSLLNDLGDVLRIVAKCHVNAITDRKSVV